MAKSVTVSVLADDVSRKTKTSKKQARQMIQATFDSIAGNLRKVERVTITGIGSFVKTIKPAQKGGKEATNPFTKERYITKSKPAQTRVKFRPAGSFKKMVGK